LKVKKNNSERKENKEKRLFATFLRRFPFGYGETKQWVARRNHREWKSSRGSCFIFHKAWEDINRPDPSCTEEVDSIEAIKAKQNNGSGKRKVERVGRFMRSRTFAINF